MYIVFYIVGAGKRFHFFERLEKYEILKGNRKNVGTLINPFQLNVAFHVDDTTKSKLETHSRKHIHGNTFGNTFAETHSNF